VSRSPTPAAPGAGSVAHQLGAWAPVAALMAITFLLSDRPGLSFSEDPSADLVIRRLGHMGAYSLLAVSFLRPLDGFASGRAALAAFVLAILWAASDEMHQAFVPDRRGAPGDVLIDATGALLGIAGLHSWRRWRRSRRS
jgi:VanZ family protein